MLLWGFVIPFAPTSPNVPIIKIANQERNSTVIVFTRLIIPERRHII